MGGGVVEILANHPTIRIEYLLVRDVCRARDFVIPEYTRVVDKWDLIGSDASVDVVVELMGGTTLAWSIVKACLEKGIHVVTANKAMISKYMTGIERILESGSTSLFKYEAAVCGGIPIINTFIRGMAADEIRSVFGVMNGSTNWMLERMDKDKTPFENLLVEAKKLGYLEADPSADICGWDARSKLCILIRLAFGVCLNEDNVVCVGIDKVSLGDVDYANKHERKMRLIARAWKDTESGKVHAFVMPSMVRASSTAGNLPGATNCVCFEGKYSGLNSFVGSGAGRYPTANSVVADILDIGRNRNGNISHAFGSLEHNENIVFDPDFESSFYVRGSDQATLQIAGVEYEVNQDGKSLVTSKCSFRKLMQAVGSECTVIAII